MLALLGLGLACFLALYAWDARSGALSRLSGLGGLEIAGQALSPGVWLKDRLAQFLRSYVVLTEVAQENARLTESLGSAKRLLELAEEDARELARLRELLALPMSPPWERAAARVIAGRFGPQAVLDSVLLDKGFLGGAAPGAPVINRRGLVGRVFRSAPHSSNVLLITDPSFRVAVLGQESRVRGILSGAGANNPLRVQYVAPNTAMRPGEILLCSGLDGLMPKGLPAARVSSARYNKDALFPDINALPLAELSRLEEVLVLIPPRAEDTLREPFQDIDELPDMPDIEQLTEEGGGEAGD